MRYITNIWLGVCLFTRVMARSVIWLSLNLGYRSDFFENYSLFPLLIIFKNQRAEATYTHRKKK